MKSILVVDDAFGIADALSDILVDVGYHVQVARNGADGLALARASHPDLMLVDLMMPIMDGTELIAAVRADPHLAATPIVLMSAVKRQRFGELACEAFLHKPFRIRELMALVDELIGPTDPVRH